MEFEVKDLDRVLETVDKIHDTFHCIHQELIFLNSSFQEISIHDYLLRISKALETIAQEMVVENETL